METLYSLDATRAEWGEIGSALLIGITVRKVSVWLRFVKFVLSANEGIAWIGGDWFWDCRSELDDTRTSTSPSPQLFSCFFGSWSVMIISFLFSDSFGLYSSPVLKSSDSSLFAYLLWSINISLYESLFYFYSFETVSD